MDSKIILTVLIVALIGIVAATYQTETNDVMNSLANVATEDSDAIESVTDLAEASIEESSSVQIDESIVQPDSSVNTKIVSTQKSSKNNQQAPTPSSTPNTLSSSSNNQANSQSSSTNTNSSSSSTNTITEQNNTQDTNTQNSNNQQSGITGAEAMSIAKSSLPSGVNSDYQKVSETTIDGKKYYEVNLYKDGEIIAYSEIDSTNGRITGGAIKGEAPEI